MIDTTSRRVLEYCHLSVMGNRAMTKRELYYRDVQSLGPCALPHRDHRAGVVIVGGGGLGASRGTLPLSCIVCADNRSGNTTYATL